tara:strand:+ start:177 stop:662 length:486 start_codon:yes stop_codon:yes gene_type:complete
MKILLFTLLTSLVFILGCSEELQELPNNPNNLPIISIEELSNEINKNYLVAQENYYNKHLIFKGSVTDLGAHINETGHFAPKQYTNQNYIRFLNSSPVINYYCTVKSRNELMTVEVGADIYVEGKIDAITKRGGTHVYINECKVLQKKIDEDVQLNLYNPK